MRLTLADAPLSCIREVLRELEAGAIVRGSFDGCAFEQYPRGTYALSRGKTLTKEKLPPFGGVALVGALPGAQARESAS